MSVSPSPPSPISAAKSLLHSLIQTKTELESSISSLNSSSHLSTPSLVDADGFPRSDLDVHQIRIHRNSLARMQTDHKNVMKQIEEQMNKLHKLAKLSGPGSSARTEREEKEKNDPNKTILTRDQSHKSDANGNANGNGNVQSQSNSSTTRIASSTSDTCSSSSSSSAGSPPVSGSVSSSSRAFSPLDAFYLVDQVSSDSPASVCGLHIGDKVVQFGSVTKANKSPTAIAELVRNSVGREVRVAVYRVGEGMLTLTLIPQQWDGRGLLGCHLTDV